MIAALDAVTAGKDEGIAARWAHNTSETPDSMAA